PTEHPDMNVGGLFADDGGDEASDSAEFDFDAEVCGFVGDASDGEGVFSFAGDKDVNQSRLLAGGDHGEANCRSRRIEIQQEDQGEPICEIEGVVEMILNRLASFVV